MCLSFPSNDIWIIGIPEIMVEVQCPMTRLDIDIHLNDHTFLNYTAICMVFMWSAANLIILEM